MNADTRHGKKTKETATAVQEDAKRRQRPEVAADS